MTGHVWSRVMRDCCFFVLRCVFFRPMTRSGNQPQQRSGISDRQSMQRAAAPTTTVIPTTASVVAATREYRLRVSLLASESIQSIKQHYVLPVASVDRSISNNSSNNNNNKSKSAVLVSDLDVPAWHVAESLLQINDSRIGWYYPRELVAADATSPPEEHPTGGSETHSPDSAIISKEAAETAASKTTTATAGGAIFLPACPMCAAPMQPGWQGTTIRLVATANRAATHRTRSQRRRDSRDKAKAFVARTVVRKIKSPLSSSSSSKKPKMNSVTPHPPSNTPILVPTPTVGHQQQQEQSWNEQQYRNDRVRNTPSKASHVGRVRYKNRARVMCGVCQHAVLIPGFAQTTAPAKSASPHLGKDSLPNNRNNSANANSNNGAVPSDLVSKASCIRPGSAAPGTTMTTGKNESDRLKRPRDQESATSLSPLDEFVALGGPKDKPPPMASTFAPTTLLQQGKRKNKKKKVSSELMNFLSHLNDN